MIQQISGAVLSHCGACMSIKYSVVPPLCQVSSQLGHTGVGVLHLSPPALHAGHSIVQPWPGTPFWHVLLQDGTVQVGARHRVLIVQIVVLSGSCFPGPPFEEEGDHLLRLFNELPEEGGHLHIAGPSGCPHHPTEPVLKLPAWPGSGASPPVAPSPVLRFPQEVQRNSLAVASQQVNKKWA